ncbi:MAG: c-type cytochrome domain-containing protein, partial [Aeoliella sp.]
MKRPVILLVGLIFFIVFSRCVLAKPDAESAADLAGPVSYYHDVRPILQARCQGCHQPAKAGGSYVLTSVEAMQHGGDSEQRGIVAGQPAASYLIEQITPADGHAEMPLEGEPLSERQVALITRWIEEGAHDDTPASASRRYDAEHPPQYTRPPTITSLDISPDGSLIAVAGFHEILLHELAGELSGKPVARLIGMSERIASVKFSPDGTKLAATGGSPARLGEVQIWDVASRELELSLPVTHDIVYGAAWSPDGKLLAFGCTDNTVRVVDVAASKQVLFQSAPNDWVLDTVFSADGSHLVSVGRDATAKLIEVATERFVDNITSITPGALGGGIHALSRHPQRDEILFGGADGVPKIYRMHRTTKRVIGDDANLLWKLPALPGRIFGVDYSDDGKLIAVGSSLNGAGAVHLYGIDPDPKISDEIN